MINAISADAFLNQIEQLKSAGNIENTGSVGTQRDINGDFSKILGNMVNDVDKTQKDADLSLKKLATGESTRVQDVVLKMEQADASFKLMLEIRNKLLSAYKELMATQSCAMCDCVFPDSFFCVMCHFLLQFSEPFATL
ncbi:Flagellar hook-basal body complex protein FliE [bioreactor metagenome]|uniref:Flagellar hook-basal body complex protein FliE n=1 Tax=bioreactor metagenome TaxID=1076179 RepID=A0A645CQ19_9ZZZZ